jgi:hypothetical protein
VNPLALIHSAYGTALVLAPGRVLRLYGGPADDPSALTVARVLGARHVLQGVATKGWRFSRVGSLVDSLHAVSMFALAAASDDYRRPALIDGCVAATFAVTGPFLGGAAPRADSGSRRP